MIITQQLDTSKQIQLYIFLIIFPHNIVTLQAAIGPVLPPGVTLSQSEDRDEEDDDIIGPSLPQGDHAETGSAAAEFERRAARMKEKLENPVSLTRSVFGIINQKELSTCSR